MFSSRSKTKSAPESLSSPPAVTISTSVPSLSNLERYMSVPPLESISSGEKYEPEV